MLGLHYSAGLGLDVAIGIALANEMRAEAMSHLGAGVRICHIHFCLSYDGADIQKKSPSV